MSDKQQFTDRCCAEHFFVIAHIFLQKLIIFVIVIDKIKTAIRWNCGLFGGERGIRTLVRVSAN